MKTKVLPRSVSDWQLYNQRGAGKAASELTAALNRVIKDINKMSSVTTDNVRKSMTEHLSPVMIKHADHGALDTEPRYVARRSIVRAVCDNKEWSYDSVNAIDFSDYLD